MKMVQLLKGCLMMVSACLFLASCAKTPFSNQEGVSAYGLGKSNGFQGQAAGESYTTSAPHNQIYLFSYDDSNFAPKYMASLNAQAEYLKVHQAARVLLIGHTDERGSREYNVALGERRANTVAELLRMAGVERHQIRVVSYGKERPANFGHDEASHMQNRRVELSYEATR